MKEILNKPEVKLYLNAFVSVIDIRKLSCAEKLLH